MTCSPPSPKTIRCSLCSTSKILSPLPSCQDVPLRTQWRTVTRWPTRYHALETEKTIIKLLGNSMGWVFDGKIIITDQDSMHFFFGHWISLGCDFTALNKWNAVSASRSPWRGRGCGNASGDRPRTSPSWSSTTHPGSRSCPGRSTTSLVPPSAVPILQIQA